MLSAPRFDLIPATLIFEHISCRNDRHEAQSSVSGFGATIACVLTEDTGGGVGILFLLLCSL